MKKILLTVLAVLAVMPASIAKGPKNQPATLKVISYNIRVGTARDGTNSWQYRYPASAMMIMDQKPDIFGLQEALKMQFDYMNEFCDGYKGVGVPRDDGKEKGEIMAIFYNTKTVKLLKWGNFWLSETPETPSKAWDAACPRTATWALLKDKRSGKKFFYINTHLDHKGAVAREKGLQLIMDRIGSINPKGYPMIITGDFNCTPKDPCLNSILEQMSDARRTAMKTDNRVTFNDWGSSKMTEPIDYVFYKGFSSCQEFQVITKEYMERKYISDHFPVSALLVF